MVEPPLRETPRKGSDDGETDKRGVLVSTNNRETCLSLVRTPMAYSASTATPSPHFLRRAKTSRPHPFEKGTGACDYFLASEVSQLASEGARCYLLGPHPSLEGRGSQPRCWRRLGANCGGKAKVSGGGMREERAKVNRDGVDGDVKTPLAPLDSVRYRRM